MPAMQDIRGGGHGANPWGTPARGWKARAVEFQSVLVDLVMDGAHGYVGGLTPLAAAVEEAAAGEGVESEDLIRAGMKGEAVACKGGDVGVMEREIGIGRRFLGMVILLHGSDSIVSPTFAVRGVTKG